MAEEVQVRDVQEGEGVLPGGQQKIELVDSNGRPFECFVDAPYPPWEHEKAAGILNGRIFRRKRAAGDRAVTPAVAARDYSAAGRCHCVREKQRFDLRALPLAYAKAWLGVCSRLAIGA
jgi:hypothetical protein